MTWNCQRHGIGRARACHGAHRSRSSDRGRHLGVRARLAVRNRRERLPDLPLKRRRLNVERQIQPRLATGQMRENRIRPSRESACIARDHGGRILALECGRQFFVRRSHGDRAHASRRGRNQQPADCRSRGIDDRVADLHARSATSVNRRRHAELRHRSLIKPAARSVSRIEHGTCDVVGQAQASFHRSKPDGLGIFARRDADETLEVALEVIRAAAESRGQRGQRRMTLDVREIDASAPDLVDPGIGDRLSRIRLAALACAEAGGACGIRRHEEPHAIASRAATRTGWPAENSG